MIKEDICKVGETLSLADIGKDGVEVVQDPGLLGRVFPHLDVVDSVAQHTDDTEEEAQANIKHGEEDCLHLFHCWLSILYCCGFEDRSIFT